MEIEPQSTIYELTLSAEEVKEEFYFSTGVLTVFPPVESVPHGVLFYLSRLKAQEHQLHNEVSSE